MTATTVKNRPFLIDAAPSKMFLAADVRDVVGIISFALLTALAAQIVIPLPFTPVPITGQTFMVLLSGAVLGPWRGLLSQGLYVVLIAAGLPFRAEAESGVSVDGSLIPTFGYLVGFVVAAFVIGQMAKQQQDRQVLSSVPAFIAGTVIIYAFGSAFLANSLGVPLVAELDKPSALAYGIAPFIVGDVIKAVAAGVLLPASWWAVDKLDKK